MYNQNLELAVIHTFCEWVGVEEDNIKLTDKVVDDLQLDSLDLLEVVMVLEEDFNIAIDDEIVESIKTVQDVVDVVRNLKESA